MLDSSKILVGLPSGLRNELLEAYEAIARNYVEHRWEPAELNGGKLCEIVFTIISGALTGSMPTKASKPNNFVAACRKLEELPASRGRIGDHSLRILIPRMLPAIYDIRNNRNVGHVGGDVNPNFMDASSVFGMASWILAELVRIFHGISIAEAQDIVDMLVERKHPLIWEVDDIRRVLDTSLSITDQALALLYGRPSWVSVLDLISWVEYSNPSKFRIELLGKLHKARMLEFDQKADRVRLSPLGTKDVEVRILNSARRPF